MIGVGLVCFFAVAGQSVKVSAGRALDTTVSGDFVVDSQSFLSGVNPALTREIQALPAVQTATGVRVAQAAIDGHSTFVVGVDPAKFTRIVHLDVIDGSFADLGRDGLALPDTVAKDRGWRVGTVVPARFALVSSQPVRVAAIYSSALPGLRYLISQDAFAANYPINQQVDNQIYVKLNAGADPERARTQIEHLARAYPTAKVLDLNQYKQSQFSQIDQLLTVVNVLLALSLVIASIGIVNTLLLSVYERTREIGLLRAVGETRRQLRRSVSEESIIITLLGTVLGLVIGLCFAWALVQALAAQHLDQFSVPVGQLVGFVVAAVIIGIVAALYPAYRASRLDVLKAISTE
jgi:putative ABC transport system permease protein